MVEFTLGEGKVQFPVDGNSIYMYNTGVKTPLDSESKILYSHAEIKAEVKIYIPTMEGALALLAVVEKMIELKREAE